MSDPQSLPDPCVPPLDCAAPGSEPSSQDASRYHDDAAACHELPLTDALLDRLRAAGY